MLDLPEPRVSRWPFELVFFVQMDRKVVSPGEALITHMALVASYKTPLKENERTTNDIKTLCECKLTPIEKHLPFYLMLSFVVNLDGTRGSRGETTARHVTAEGRLAAVAVQVFTQVDQILTATNAKIKN